MRRSRTRRTSIRAQIGDPRNIRHGLESVVHRGHRIANAFEAGVIDQEIQIRKIFGGLFDIARTAVLDLPAGKG